MVPQAQLALQAQVDLLELQALLVQVVPLAQLVLQEQADMMVQQALPVRQVIKEPLEPRDQQAPQEPAEQPVL